MPAEASSILPDAGPSQYMTESASAEKVRPPATCQPERKSPSGTVQVTADRCTAHNDQGYESVRHLKNKQAMAEGLGRREGGRRVGEED